MLTNTAQLKGIAIHATDGELGTADGFYFDDDTWAIRYLTVETGGWLGGRRVLISPFSVVQTDWQARRLDVALTKKQIENSPGIDTHRPVSRQHEAAYLGYYGYPYYWGGPYLWGPAFFPAGLAIPTTISREAMAERVRKESTDSHLRSSEAVTGYHIEATDGELGHVDGFLMDDQAWAIRYLEVATRNWWPGRKVLVSPAWVGRSLKCTPASPGKPSSRPRSTPRPLRSLENTKTCSTFTMAGRRIGNTTLPCRPASRSRRFAQS